MIHAHTRVNRAIVKIFWFKFVLLKENNQTNKCLKRKYKLKVGQSIKSRKITE